MSRQLFIQNVEPVLTAGSIPGGAIDPASGTNAGKLAFVDIDGVVIDFTTSTKITNPFSIYQLNAAGESLIQSNLIKPEGIKRAKLSLFSAEVKQTTTVDALPTTGNIYLKVTRIDKGYKEKTFTFTIEAGSTATASATALVAEINKINENDRFFTASSSGTVVTLTGKDGYVSFVTQAFNDADEAVGTVAAGDTPTRGIGTVAHLNEINKYAESVRGNIFRAWLPQEFKNYVGNAIDAGLTIDGDGGSTPTAVVGYDLIQLTIDAGLDASIGVQTYEITLAFPASGTAADSVLAGNSITQTTLNGLFGV